MPHHCDTRGARLIDTFAIVPVVLEMALLKALLGGAGLWVRVPYAHPKCPGGPKLVPYLKTQAVPLRDPNRPRGWLYNQTLDGLVRQEGSALVFLCAVSM